jgi:hypothetical protein
VGVGLSVWHCVTVNARLVPAADLVIPAKAGSQ